MKGDFISNDDDLLECRLTPDNTWLFEPDDMMLSTVLHGRPLHVDLTKLIEGDVDLERPIQAWICSRMSATGIVEHFSLTLNNSAEQRSLASIEMNRDLGAAIASMDFQKIGRSIIFVVSSLMERHNQTFEALLEADQLTETEEDLMIPRINDFDMRLENILKDILTS